MHAPGAGRVERTAPGNASWSGAAGSIPQASMATEGIEAVFLETHNWGRAARFFQALGYELDFETDHGSGQLRRGDGPSLFIAEVPEDRPVDTRLVLRVLDASAFEADPVVDVVTPFAPTHWGTQEMTVRDPDGRLWSLQAPGAR